MPPGARLLAAMPRSLLLCLPLLASVSAQYGPDPPGTPSDFKCAWRKLAAKYAHINRPDADAKVHDSLQLSEYCKDTPRPNEAALPAVFPPPSSSDSPPPVDAVYADAEQGSDSTGTGTRSKPFASIQKAVNVAATKPAGSRHVVLRNGTFYLSQTVQIPHAAHGLVIEGMAGEAAWVSGGTKLDKIKWKPHNLTHDMNIWAADLSAFNLKDVPGLRVNGRRVSPARYPNADPELTFWPTGYMTSDGSRPCSGFNVSCGSREPCEVGCGATWKAPKIAPKPNPAHVVNVTESSHARLWDVQFTHCTYCPSGSFSCYATRPQSHLDCAASLHLSAPQLILRWFCRQRRHRWHLLDLRTPFFILVLVSSVFCGMWRLLHMEYSRGHRLPYSNAAEVRPRAPHQQRPRGRMARRSLGQLAF
eukprot:COSAG05_NODE_1072_length_5963_cov_9.550477_5_plen_418_part_00